jgi:hypothetical protein
MHSFSAVDVAYLSAQKQLMGRSYYFLDLVLASHDRKRPLISDLRVQLDSQNAGVKEIKEVAADCTRDKDRHKRETWERNNPDGEAKGGRKKGAKNTKRSKGKEWGVVDEHGVAV